MSGGAPAHPSAATVAALAALAGPGIPDPAGTRAVEVVATLPSLGGRPVGSPPFASSGTAPRADEAPALAAWRVPGLACEAPAAAQALLSLAAQPAESRPDGVLGDDVRFWMAATRFALELLHRQRAVPALEKDGDAYSARWRLLLDEEADAQRYGALASALPPVCRALAWDTGASPPAARRLLRSYLDAVADGVARGVGPGASAVRGAGRTAPRRRASATGGDVADVWQVWWGALLGAPLVEAAPAALLAFEQQYRAWIGGAAASPGAADTFRVCFRLDPPPGDGDASQAPPTARTAGPAAAWQLSYFLQATDDPSLLVPAGEAWRQRGATLRFLNRRFDQPQERLLAGLGRAARLVPPIEASLRQARPEACTLSTSEAHHFIKEAAVLLRSGGFGVLVPGLQSPLRLRVHLGSPTDPAKSTGTAGFTWASLVAYDWQVALGDEPLTREEFEQLARLKEPLVQVRGRWLELDPAQVEQALAFFERRTAAGKMALPDALRLALAPESMAGSAGLPIAAVDTAGWIDGLLRHLGKGRQGGQRGRMPEPPGFVGRLRPYQKVGVSWLATLQRYGLGACLADDMGLGKTPTTIALWLHERAAPLSGRPRRAARAKGAAPAASTRSGGPAGPGGPVLLVCPTSVVGNWQREVECFAPNLKVLVHHGAGRTREQFAAAAAAHDVVISTYALLHRDEEALGEVEWRAVVLDEAQNIKNAATKAAQAARRLRAGWRAALTGTPVENRVSELWSLFQFLNPGYLGTAEDFRRRFANPIERANDAGAAAQLKALVAPFILRRVKTDRAVIADLPEKNEMKVFCPLTREQATLYEAVVRDSLRQIEESEGVQRRGVILATLTKLKQVCDHPALFLHDASALAGRSGKLARLGEMLEETLAVEDRSLIFTQYAAMGRLLKTHLEARFGQDVLFLHGGTPARNRDDMVARFQHEGRAPRVFVLSLKAGGTGLNLTRANHVFHFDRWWNPAVENQATDRAFRIGQQRDVQVHKFICAGTFEETLDQLIERKVALSQAIVGAGETWITEMNTAELRDLFALRRGAGDAVVDMTGAAA